VGANTQLDWDTEDLQRFRRRVVGLATEAGTLTGQEQEARGSWREKRKARSLAAEELAQWVNTPRPKLADAEFAGEARRLTDLVVGLEQEERSALSAWKLLSARRRRAQLELQTTVRAWHAPAPLFDTPKDEPEPVIEKDLEKVLGQEAEADEARETEYRFEDLAVSVKQLDAAYIGSLFAGGKTHEQPAQVHPVEFGGKPWVCFGVTSDHDSAQTWNLLPLYPLNGTNPDDGRETFGSHYGIDAHKETDEVLRLGPARPTHERGYYFGVVVRVGRGKHGTHVIGANSEIVHVRKDDTPKEPDPEAAYAWEMTVKYRDGREEKVTYAAKSKTAAWRKAMMRPLAMEVLDSEPMTREQYVRVKGTRRARL
jgi:hypothetical protein